MSAVQHDIKLEPPAQYDHPYEMVRLSSSREISNCRKPSFDCSKAKTAAARLICADGELARLDGELGVAFRKRKAQISAPDQSDFVAEQLAWIKDRNTRCVLNEKNAVAIEVLARAKPCMVNAIRERIAFLAQTDSVAARAAPPPEQPLALVPPQSDEMAREQTAPIAQRRATALAEAKAAADKAFHALADCTLTQAANLMVTNETAEAVAAAALVLCPADLENATLAVDYETDLQLWFDGPQPRPRLSTDIEAERSLAKTLLPRLAARIMQSRAEAAKALGPQASGTGDTLGTGFFVAKDGKALTNAHVVDRCHEMFVGFDGQQATARVVARDNDNDLALLATDLHPASAPNWRLSIRQGEEIVVYGYPLAGVLATGGNVAVGNVTALAGLGNDSRFLQISAPVQPGNSGGPLLDRSGNVVGIVVAKLDALGIAAATGDIPQNVNFAIKASVAAAFLDAHGVMHAEGESSPALSTPDIAERAKGLTMQVACVPSINRLSYSVEAQSLSGVRIGDTLAQAIETVGMKPSRVSTIGPFNAIAWTFPGANSLSVTASIQTGKIVYAESDWGGGAQHDAFADFPNMTYGETTLADIRKRFGSNGMAFEERSPVMTTDEGVVLLNAYEVGQVIVTFVTRVRKEGAAAKNAADVSRYATLDSISIADPSYARSWGKPIKDQAYKPIEWK